VLGDTLGAAEAVVEPLYWNPIPPLTAKSANAKGFKIIVPISGNNQP